MFDWNSLPWVSTIYAILGWIGAIVVAVGAIVSVLELHRSKSRTTLHWVATIVVVVAAVVIWMQFLAGNIRESLLEQHGKKLENQLLGAQKKISSLEAKQGPRRLTDQQKVELAHILSSYFGQLAGIYSRQGDTEAAAFGNDFESVFQKAGWNVGRGWGSPYLTDWPPMGVTIGVAYPKQTSAATNALISALKGFGMEIEVVERKGDRPSLEGGGADYIALQIGQRK